MRKSRLRTGMLTVWSPRACWSPAVFAAEFSREDAAKYILATAKAFRSVYSKQIVDRPRNPM